MGQPARGASVTDKSLVGPWAAHSFPFSVASHDTDVMSVALPGSRLADDRRRRRLAVSGDATGADSPDGDAAGVTTSRHRPAETPSISPWLPQQLWKRCVVLGLFWATLLVCGLVLVRPLLLPAPVARLLMPIVSGTSPRLMMFLDIGLWILAAELAGIIGWYRSHSQLDFSGRYRVWGWIALSFLAAGFLSATRLPEALALEYSVKLPYLTWRRETLAWLLPMLLWGSLTGWLIDRDVRRCLSSLVLWRLSALAGLTLAAGALWSAELCCETWFPAAMLGLRLLMMGLLVTAMWRQACYVAYVCPDPPAKVEKSDRVSLLSRMLARWWKPVAEEASTETSKPSRRRRKAAEDTEGEAEATPAKRKRKTTKARKPARRTRSKPDPEETEYEEETAETSEEEGWETASSEDTDQGDESSNWSEEDEELAQLEALTRPESAPQPTNGNRSGRAAAESAWQESDDESDGDYGGVDDGHRGSDMYKGLSKRQRRELKKQQREAARDH